MRLSNNSGKNPAPMNSQGLLKLVFLACLICIQITSSEAQTNTGKVTIQFENVANNRPIALRDSFYTNSFNEIYQVTKLKYYISDIQLVGSGNVASVPTIFLVDEEINDSLRFAIPAGSYHKLIFTLGLDSALNNSGAQDGLLDPLKGMFWTWNSGYVYFKLEGFSSSSTADLQRIEHHIGGYTGVNKAARQIELPLPASFIVGPKGNLTITVRMDLDRYWKGRSDITIASNALIMAPGPLAVKSADNFEGLFSIIDVK
jgi:hypothetical protein